MTAYIRDTLDDMPDFRVYLEAVHRLSDLGAVVTWVSSGTSHAGFQAEWREISIATVEGDLINRSEMFDETDLDAALARFDELTRSAPRLQNSASRVFESVRASLAARDWDAMAGLLAANASNEDRRRVLNAEVRLGRESVIEDLQASVDVIGITYTTVSVIATRGERLVLVRARLGDNDRPDEVQFDVLQLIGLGDEDRVATVITFDADDFDAAFAELDARYMAGEAAAHAHTWSVFMDNYAAFNRREIPPTSPGLVDIDHRPLAAIGSGDLMAYLHDFIVDLADVSIYIESVHRLTDRGAVVTHVGVGTSQDGFDAEWRVVYLATLDGDLINRGEIFEEADLDTALSRFDELAELKPRLENEATRIGARLADAYNRRDLDAYLSLASPDGLFIDRRQGLHSELEASLRQNLQAVLEVSPNSFEMTWEPIATRGSRLSLAHEVWRDHSQDNHPIAVELLTVMEVSDTGLLRIGVAFDPDDIDAAFAELEARYRDGEAACEDSDQEQTLNS